MREFIKKGIKFIVLTLGIFSILLLIYLIQDPFKVIRDYNSYLVEDGIVVNRDHQSCRSFIHNYPRLNITLLFLAALEPSHTIRVIGNLNLGHQQDHFLLTQL